MPRKPASTPLEESDRPSRQNAAYLSWRIAVLGFLVFALIAVFLVRIYFLSVVRGPDFFELSEDNFLRDTPIEAPRGKLLSSEGIPLSLNQPIYEVRMSRFLLDKETIRESLSRLATLLGRPDIRERSEEIEKSRPSWKPVLIARDLDSEKAAPVVERLYELPGVSVEPRFVRHHPEGAALAHVTGYVSSISPAQLPDYQKRDYLQTDLIGKISAEKQFEDYLRGVHGTELTIHDAVGRLRSSYVQRPAERGNDIKLTINLRLQHLADQLMKTHSGVLIAMNPRDGSILALSSKPDYDPNRPMQGISSGKASSYNKAVRGLYAPGSTFKLVTAAAGLIAGFDPNAKIDCPGRFYLPNVKRPFYCDVRWGHGPLNMEEALQRSCNVFFYTWADRLGHDRLYQVARQFGFGEPSGIDLLPTVYEPSGILPPSGSKGIYRGSIIQMGIGQGALISATPLQILGAYAALANNGKRVRPHVLDSVLAPNGQLLTRHQTEVTGELPVSTHQADLLREGFYRVVHTPGGTGYGRGFADEWEVAGKTGSSEVAGQHLTNGLFVCYAPADDPQVAMIGIVEAEGHGGAIVIPLIIQMMAEYFVPGSGVVPEPEPAEGTVASAGDGDAGTNPDLRSRAEGSRLPAGVSSGFAGSL